MASEEEVQMAARLGLHRSYLADMERGKRNVSLVSVAGGFGLTLSQLLARV
jgi:transcriptional regulator with XRE-family HTH domain